MVETSRPPRQGAEEADALSVGSSLDTKCLRDVISDGSLSLGWPRRFDLDDFDDSTQPYV